MAAKKTVVANPTDRIAELVERRDHLIELRDLTNAAPRSLAEAEADIPKTIEILASRCEPQTAWLAQEAGGFASLAHQLAQSDPDYGPIPPASLMAWALPDVLAAALKRDLAASYEALPAPMASAAKHAELARLQAEIAGVEAELAAVWWTAVDAGLQPAVPPVSGVVLVGLSD